MNMRKAFFAATLLASWAPAAVSQPSNLEVERVAVLKSNGDVERVAIQLFPLEADTDLAFRHVISRTDALSLRLHFSVRRAADGWNLRIKGSDGFTWTMSSRDAPATGFWSDEVPGSSIEIEIESPVADNAVELIVDRLVIGTTKITPVSIVGPNQLSPIGRQDPGIVSLGHSVARLRFIADSGQSFFCTAFLITRDLMLTNQHCLATQSETDSALVDFDFDRADAQHKTMRLKELLATNEPLDFSVVRLTAPVERAPLRLATTRPSDQNQLLIIQHPAGETKQVSLADCIVAGTLVPGRDGTPTDFGHSCDTKGGSSGSPVFSFEGMNVIGLHHLGFSPGRSNAVNRATHIDLVLAAMRDELRAEIEN